MKKPKSRTHLVAYIGIYNYTYLLHHSTLALINVNFSFSISDLFSLNINGLPVWHVGSKQQHLEVIFMFSNTMKYIYLRHDIYHKDVSYAPNCRRLCALEGRMNIFALKWCKSTNRSNIRYNFWKYWWLWLGKCVLCAMRAIHICQVHDRDKFNVPYPW